MNEAVAVFETESVSTEALATTAEVGHALILGDETPNFCFGRSMATRRRTGDDDATR